MQSIQRVSARLQKPVPKMSTDTLACLPFNNMLLSSCNMFGICWIPRQELEGIQTEIALQGWFVA